MPKPLLLRRSVFLPVVALAAVLAGGVLLAWWMTAPDDRNMRTDLPDRARVVAGAVGTDAGGWEWDEAGRVALPAGVALALLILLIAVVVVLRTPERASARPVTGRLMVPLAAILLALIGGFGAVLVTERQERLADMSRRTLEEATGDLEQLLAEQARGLTAVQEVLVREPALAESLRARDRRRLLADYLPLFERLNEDHAVTHFYFSDPDRVCLLRVHKPDKHGDRFDRFTALEAQRTGRTAAGIELGPLGTFTLRVVRPVFDEDELIGYLELGKEIEDILDGIGRHEEVKLAVVIRKSALGRAKWEAGMKMLSREAAWDRFADDVIIYSSLSPFPAEAERFVAGARFEGDDNTPAGLREPSPYGTMCDRIAFDGRHWHVLASPLADASGAPVGRLIVLNDVSTLEAAQNRVTAVVAGTTLVLLAVLFGVVFVMLRRTDAGIRAQQAALRQSAQRFKSLFMDSPVSILIHDRDTGAIVDANPTACSLYGLTSAEEFRSCNMWLDPPYSFAEAMAWLRKAALEGPQQFEWLGQKATGETFWEQVHLCPVTINGTERILATTIDITGRKQAEEALAERVKELTCLQKVRNDVDAGLSIEDVCRRAAGHLVDAMQVPERSQAIVQVGDREFVEGVTDAGAAHGLHAEIASGGRVQGRVSIVCPQETAFLLPEEQYLVDAVARILRDWLDRRRAKEALREQQQRLAFVIEGSRLGTWMWNVQTNETLFNETWATMLGYTLDDLTPTSIETWESLTHPDDLQKAKSLLAPRLAGELSDYQSELRMKHKDGHWVWMQDRGRIMTRDAEGKPLMMFGTHDDINDRKLAEAALLESESKYRALVENANDIIYSLSPEGVFQYVSPNWTTMLGHDPSEVEGSNFAVFVHPDDVAICQGFLEKVLASGQKQAGAEYRVRHTDGSWRWHTSNASALRDCEGRIISCVGIARDITDRKRAEEALREALAQSTRHELEVASLLEAARAVLKHRRFEDAARHIFALCKERVGAAAGYVALLADNGDENEVVFLDAGGAPCTVDPSLPMPIRGLRSVAYRTGAPAYENDFANSEWTKFMPKGHVHLKNAMFAPLMLDGRAVGLIGLANKPAEFTQEDVKVAASFSDIAAVALLNSRNFDALEEAKEELEQTVHALESANRALEEFNQLAETATRAKSEFLANMSHEIRTPMTAILGFADVLLGEPGLERAPPERVEAFKTIRRNGMYLLELINDILDLSKIEAGKLDVERTTCSPLQVLDEVVTLMRVRADAKGLPLKLEFEGGVPERIYCDPLRLKQILINLVGNAIKFTETGSVRMVASVAHRLAGPPLLQVDVIDTGIGLTDEQARNLFQPFSQADSSTARKYGGTGLGLTISKRLAEILGGNIVLRSEPGKGSTFTVTVDAGDLEGVKLIKAPEETDARACPAPATEKAAAVRLTGRILLAEDGPDNQRLIAFLLRKAGADVTVAENGQIAYGDALAALERGEPFDLVLMDIQMPVMDGYEATRRLRAAGYAGPIIALTAHAMAGDQEKCRAAGCDGHLTKPIDHATFLPTIARCISALPSGEEASTTARIDEQPCIGCSEQ